MSANVGMVDRDRAGRARPRAHRLRHRGVFGPTTGFKWIGWIGVVPLITGLVGSCPLYSLLGLSTCATR